MGVAAAAIARWGALVAVSLGLATSCVTVAEFRKLQREVVDMKRGSSSAGAGAGSERLADLAAEVSGLQEEVLRLSGRLEVAEHRVEQALREARAARAEAAGAAAPHSSIDDAPTAESAQLERSGGMSDEVRSYRTAYAAWRGNEAEACIDLFKNFLQTYPDSAYADDAAYWMADCYFKHGDYKTAVLRFDDVVARYPTGNKAAEALYRQGEALLRLGPGYGKAAGKAFERVIKEYPDSVRAPEARRQLALLGSG